MVTENRDVAPYAPVHNVLTIIRRLRERGLPDPLTLQELERTGIPAGNAPRTLAALRFLGLVSEDGYRTEAFDRLGKASTDQYPEVLAAVLRAAYASVFTLVDPSVDNDIAIHDAFRHYKPQMQRNRMVTLFLGLCREAGIVPGGPPKRKAKMRGGESARAATQKRGDDVVVTPETARLKIAASPPEVQTSDGPDFRLIAGLMQRLPHDGKWSVAQRNKWLQAVTANVDLMVEIVEEDAK